MRLVKYHFAFIVGNLLLMLVINYGISGDWTFRLFLLTWLASVALSVLVIGYFSSRFFRLIRPVLRLLAVWVTSFIICNLFMASLDPNQVGWLNNLVSTYEDTGTLYLVVLPYITSMILTCAWCAAGVKSKTPAVAPADRQLV